MSADFFEQLAGAQISAPLQSRMRAVETRRARAASGDKKLEEKESLLKLYRAGKKADLDRLLDGPQGKDVRGLVAFMRSMTLSSSTALVWLVEGAHWMRGLTAAERDIVESLIFRGIARLREKNGLPFWDDPLPGEAPKAFDEIQDIMRGRT